MSKTQLAGSARSPYTRRLRLLLHAHPGTEIEFKAINYLENPADAEYLKSVSPITKIPILMSSEGTIFESRVIANYWAKKLNLDKWIVNQSETNPAHWNYVTMSLLSYVDWAVFRKMTDFSKHPGLTDFVTRFNTKPGVSETAIPV